MTARDLPLMVAISLQNRGIREPFSKDHQYAFLVAGVASGGKRYIYRSGNKRPDLGPRVGLKRLRGLDWKQIADSEGITAVRARQIGNELMAWGCRSLVEKLRAIALEAKD